MATRRNKPVRRRDTHKRRTHKRRTHKRRYRRSSSARGKSPLLSKKSIDAVINSIRTGRTTVAPSNLYALPPKKTNNKGKTPQ